MEPGSEQGADSPLTQTGPASLHGVGREMHDALRQSRN